MPAVSLKWCVLCVLQGEATIPLDRWFGTFRDGQSAADGKISVRKTSPVRIIWHISLICAGCGGFAQSTPGISKEAGWVTLLTGVVGSAIGVLPLVPLLKTSGVI